MKLKPPSIKDYLWRLANISIGGSTLRNQGAAGVAKVARTFLADLDLNRFVKKREDLFCRELDHQTNLLKKRLPKGARHWGTSRKAINIFLGEAYYHRFICEEYGLRKIERFLEVPLDRMVAEFLLEKTQFSKVKLPSWPGVKNLTPSISKQYQDFAYALVKGVGEKMARIHLDVLIWRGPRHYSKDVDDNQRF